MSIPRRLVSDDHGMRIGLKLDAGFDDDVVYRRLYGTEDVPRLLGDMGVEAVEIPLGPESDDAFVLAQARRCQAAGLTVSFHPYSEGLGANPTYFTGASSEAARVHTRFLQLATAVAELQGRTIVNIHPTAVGSGVGDRGVLVDRSVRFFDWAQEWCTQHAPDVQPVAELQVAPNPEEDLVRIGDTPEELAQVVEGGGVGACWDVGHAVINHRRFGTVRDPSEALLGRIHHVHCHDVVDSDHYPPRRGDAPWAGFLRRLGGSGYDRTVIIEVTPPTFLGAGGLPAVEESVAAVRDAAGCSSPH